jgi:hypothetical protein
LPPPRPWCAAHRTGRGAPCAGALSSVAPKSRPAQRQTVAASLKVPVPPKDFCAAKIVPEFCHPPLSMIDASRDGSVIGHRSSRQATNASRCQRDALLGRAKTLILLREREAIRGFVQDRNRAVSFLSHGHGRLPFARFAFAHRTVDAYRARALRSAAVIVRNRAVPPSRPSATAAGFFSVSFCGMFADGLPNRLAIAADLSRANRRASRSRKVRMSAPASPSYCAAP